MDRTLTSPPGGPDWLKRMQELYLTSPMHHYLGLTLDEVADGAVVVGVSAKAELTNALGMLHGSVQMAALDSAILQAVRTRCGESDHLVTVELKVNFLAAAFGAGFTCHAEVLRLGGAIGVAEARIKSPEGDIIAGGLGTIYVRRQSRR